MDSPLEAALSGGRVLVSDFDATMTTTDFFELALAHLPPGTPDFFGQYLHGEISHFEALRLIFSKLPGDEQLLLDIARQTQPDPDLAASIRRLNDSGWEVIVTSAGCAWYVERLLAERQISIPIVSNPGTVAVGQGLAMTLPRDQAFFCEESGVDKAALVERALQQCEDVAFAGDGRADLGAALLLPPHRRFAKRWLARQLSERRLGFRYFDTWSQVSRALTTE